MQIQDLPLSGAKLITLPAFPDERGLFIKTFHDTTLKSAGIDFDLKESYLSVSNKDVIRGVHFQTPPAQHAKIVFCPSGAILDLILDLRKGSPTYGKFHTEILSAENHRAFYIPEGFAHGFRSLAEGSITYYLVSSEHHKESDTGLRWDSIGYDWECQTPIMSVRDLSFGTLEDFDSPF